MPEHGAPGLTLTALDGFRVGHWSDRGEVRPGPAEGYAACMAASAAPVAEGCVGVGTGATVGKLAGLQHAMKGGLGSAALALGDGTLVGALVVVNALGDVIDPSTG